MSGEEDMDDTTYLGDITEQHYHTPSAAGNIAKTLAAAGLLAAGLGTAAALPIAAYNMTKGEAVAPTPVTGPDSDTQYGLRVFRPTSDE